MAKSKKAVNTVNGWPVCSIQDMVDQMNAEPLRITQDDMWSAARIRCHMNMDYGKAAEMFSTELMNWAAAVNRFCDDTSRMGHWDGESFDGIMDCQMENEGYW
jgi:hypothetical protein